MAAPADNLLRNVQLYQKYTTAYLYNAFSLIKNCNTRFNNWETFVSSGNYGDTVSFRQPYKMVAHDDLDMTFDGVEQRLITLTVDKPLRSGYAFDERQYTFYDGEELLSKNGQPGESAMNEIGARAERLIANNFVDNTYRFYGNGKTSISTYGDLVKALAFFRNFGNANYATKGWVPDLEVPNVINTGLNQFAPNRANKDVMDWELGSFANSDWFSNNQLQIHMSGTIGESQYDISPISLTVVSTTKDANGGITAITFSGAPLADANAIKKNDLLWFTHVDGIQDIRYLQFSGHQMSGCPVQFRATLDKASDGTGLITIPIYPTLNPVVGDKNQNIPFDIVAGMQVQVVASHYAAGLNSGDTMYLAMPKLPNLSPYTCSNESHDLSGISCRLFYGSVIAQGQAPIIGNQHTLIMGTTCDPDNTMRLCFPIR